MLQAEFDILTRSDLEKLKFVLDSNGDVAIRVLGGSGGVSTFVSLTDGPGAYTGQAGKGVKVNAGESALEYYSIATGGGTGDVVGPNLSVDSNIAVFDGITGKIIKDSGYSILTSVPGGAVFTDTTYSIGDAGLTEINFTTALSILLGNQSGVNTGDQDLSGLQNTSEKNNTNGYAGLDATGKINPLQLPSLAISETFVVASEVEQLALTVQEGDIAVRTDENQSYIALNDTNGTMADWQVLLTPTDSVSSVAGKTGVVTLDKNDVGLGNVDNTTDLEKPISTATQISLITKENTFSKNTAFNLDFGTTAGTVLEGDTDIGKVGTKAVSETSIGDTKILAYNSTSGELEYIAQPTGGSGGGLRETIQLGGTQTVGSILYEGAIGSASTLSAGYISLKTAPTGSDFIISISKSTDDGVTYGTAETATLTATLKYIKRTLSGAYAEGDWMKIEVTQVGSSVAGQGLLFTIIGS